MDAGCSEEGDVDDAEEGSISGVRPPMDGGAAPCAGMVAGTRMG